MKKAYKRWACGLLAGILALLVVCGGIVYAVDPYCYYRMPDKWQPVFFDERNQMVGYAKHSGADTVLLGTSMAANYRASWIEEVMGGKATRITLPDGYLSEFDAAVETVFRSHAPKRVLFSLDANILHRDESGKTDSMPEYLYNAGKVDDIKYLLNKDALYYSAFVLMSNRWGGITSQDEAFTWDEGIWWNHMTALDNYKRPEQEPTLAAGAWEKSIEDNLAIVESWIREHPDTEFDIFFPPYSILFWDKSARLGHTEAVFAMLEQTCDTLLAYDNVKLYGFLWEPEMVENLDNYCDYIHHSGTLSREVLERIAADKNLVTAENAKETLANWREYVVDYNYEKFWDENYWHQWNAQQQK